MASDDDFGGPPPIEIPTESLEFEYVQRDKKVKSSLGRRILLLTILVAAIGGAGVWWVFDGQYSTMFASDNNGQIPTVHAEISPVKVKPENPGGMDVPNRDKLVYERLGQKPASEPVERLLPEAEKPMPMPKPQPTPEKAVEPAKMQANKDEPPKPPAVPMKKVVEEKIASVVPTEKEVAAVQAPKPAEVAKPVELKTPAPKPVASVAPAPKPAAVSTTKSYQIQLAAVRSTATAQSEWKRMQAKFPNELGRLSLNIVKADLGKKGIFYRLRAGPIENAKAAKTICASLKAKKAGCLIVLPGK